MNGLHGIIFAYEKAPGLRELTEARMPGSVPFGGRYRVVDFMPTWRARASQTSALCCTATIKACSTTSAAARRGTWRARTAVSSCCRPLPTRASSAWRNSAARWRRSRACGRTCTRSGRSTSSCPTATLSSICRCRRCWTRTSKAARTSPASAPRAASLWKTPRISPSTKRAASPRRAARRTRRAAAAAWKFIF